MSLQQKAPGSLSLVPRIRAHADTRDTGDVIDLISKVARDALVLIEVWRETARQRRALSRLDDRMLRDVGLTREQVMRELGRPFWDVWTK